MADIRLWNTRTRSKVPLEPTVAPGKVSMYVCGPTVYDRAHMGNARPVIVFDVLYRLLRHSYGAENVTYVRNLTDVDDKIIRRAEESGEAIDAITEKTIRWFHEDMGALGVLPPDHEPRATAYIAEMIAMIEGLIASGHAYAAEGHVLFSVESYDAYGALSGRSVEDMIAGARVEVAPYKRNPMDFVLWKPSEPDVPGWESPWGRGRPGWHIECSAMSQALLGESFDIHGGGNDLMFPHHENEIAQSRCAHPESDFARIWMHNEMLQVEGKKMSKSLGNFFTVHDVLEQGVPGEVIRFVYLSTHYRKPMDWTAEKAREAERELEYWAGVLVVDDEVLELGPDSSFVDEQVVEALADDLNTSLALTRLKTMARFNDNSPKFRELSDSNQLKERRKFLSTAMFIGIDLVALTKKQSDRLSDRDLVHFELVLAEARIRARESKDFSEVDRLKAQLVGAGVEVRMSKDRIELVPGPNFRKSALESIS